MKKIFLLLPVFVLWACASQPAVREKAYRNLVYANPQGRDLKLDLFVPEISRLAPLIVWFHGGGWQYGDKS